MIQRKTVLGIAAVVASAAAIGVLNREITDFWNRKSDDAEIYVTKSQGWKEPQDAKKVEVDNGNSVWIRYNGSAREGIKRERIYVNDILHEEREVGPYEGLPVCRAWGGGPWELKTTAEGFRIGKNRVAYEVQDKDGRLMRDSVEVFISNK